MRYGVFGAFVLLLLACSSRSPAQEAPAPHRPAEVRRWYGWQTFTTDGVAVGLFVGAVAADGNTPLYGSSALVFGLGAPVVHLAHLHWEYALCSVGLRVGTPLLGGVLGSQFDPDNTRADGSGTAHSSTRWAIAGVAIGGLAASFVDGFVLAYDQESAPPQEPERNQLLELEASPTLVLIPRGALFGLSGSL